MRVGSILVSSCVALAAFIGTATAQSASAETVTAMLAKSQTLDERCNILADADRQELMDFLARAEILLAEQQSVKVARSAISQGRAQGEGASCGPDQASFVKGVLSTARASTAIDEPVQPAVEEPAPAQLKPSIVPIVEAKKVEPTPEPKVADTLVEQPKPVKAAETKPVKKKPAEVKPVVVAKKDKTKPVIVAEIPVKKKNKGSLVAYAGIAQKYYAELKCRNMSGGAVKRLYANVLSNHKQALAENSASAVRSVLRTAEARANASRCT